MESSIKKAIAFVIAVILTFSVVTFVKNSNITASAASSSSISIRKSPTLKVRKIRVDSVKLSWTKTKNATSYKLYKSTDNKNWKKVATTKDTSYTVKKLTPGAKYYFKLIAISGNNKSPYSKTVTAVPKPEKVGYLKINFKSNTKVFVSWDKITGATGYELFYSTSLDFKKNLKKVTVKGGDKTSYTIRGMKNGKTYYAKVRAVTTVGKKTVVGICSPVSQLVTKTKTSYLYENGTKYSVDENGIKRIVNDSPDITENRGDECPVCGKTTCIQSIKDYYCVICKKTIKAFTCHPASHYGASY